MIYSQERDRLRQFWCDVWRKARAGAPLEPLEQIIASVVSAHPEYHALLANPEASTHRDWLSTGEVSNPFLHLGMHLALQESLATDRPAGVRSCYQALMTRLGDAHIVEHRMMECLADVLWQAQRRGGQPNERDYLDCLQRLLTSNVA